jgi:hypothetical protein
VFAPRSRRGRAPAPAAPRARRSIVDLSDAMPYANCQRLLDETTRPGVATTGSRSSWMRRPKRDRDPDGECRGRPPTCRRSTSGSGRGDGRRRADATRLRRSWRP